MSKPIDWFDGTEHDFLSNFHVLLPITWEGKTWPTTEHAFQAAKLHASYWRYRERIRKAKGPGKAKELGQRSAFEAAGARLRPDWETAKWDVMLDLLRIKFAHPRLGWALLGTGLRELIEGNSWNDTCWGVCKGVGTNWLGRALMVVRHEERRKALAAAGTHLRSPLWQITLILSGGRYGWTKERHSVEGAKRACHQAVYEAADAQALRDRPVAHDCLAIFDEVVKWDTANEANVFLRDAHIEMRRFK